MNLPRLHGPPNSVAIWRHWSRHLTATAHQPFLAHPEFKLKAVDDLWELYADVLHRTKWKDKVHVLPHDFVLAGADGITAIDRIDLNTSMGWPLNTPKKKYVQPSERQVPGITEALDVDPFIMDEVFRVEELLATGIRVYFVNRANLKDEPTKFTKDKIRVFAGAPFALVYLVRKYFLTIVRFIQTNGFELETGVGINAQGPEWDALVRHLKRFGCDQGFDGDYSDFDQKQSPDWTLEAWGILYKVACESGYDERSLCVMRGLITEIVYPIFEHDGIIVQLFGSNPSGHPCTVIINNLVNQLYMRYAYYARELPPDSARPSFARAIALMCYGDDNVAGPGPGFEWFNLHSVTQELSKIGVKYTDASKRLDAPPLRKWEALSFLKRAFRYDQEVGRYMGPLEEASICKSLHNYRHNKNCPQMPLQISASAILSASREYFQHGRDVYTVKGAQLAEVARQTGADKYLGEIPSYDDYLALERGECDFLDTGITEIPFSEHSGELELSDTDSEGHDFLQYPYFPAPTSLITHRAVSVVAYQTERVFLSRSYSDDAFPDVEIRSVPIRIHSARFHRKVLRFCDLVDIWSPRSVHNVVSQPSSWSERILAEPRRFPIVGFEWKFEYASQTLTYLSLHMNRASREVVPGTRSTISSGYCNGQFDILVADLMNFSQEEFVPQDGAVEPDHRELLKWITRFNYFVICCFSSVSLFNYFGPDLYCFNFHWFPILFWYLPEVMGSTLIVVSSGRSRFWFLFLLWTCGCWTISEILSLGLFGFLSYYNVRVPWVRNLIGVLLLLNLGVTDIKMIPLRLTYSSQTWGDLNTFCDFY
jgi:hypothetical protein